MYYILFLCMLEISLDKVKEKNTSEKCVPFKLSPEISMCYIKIMENTVWLMRDQVKYCKIRRAWYCCPM